MQEKLLTYNVTAELLVIEGINYCHFILDPNVTESSLYFNQVIKLCDKKFK